MYECIIYQNDFGIFNIECKEKRYKQNTPEIIRFIFTKDQVYENKKINKKLWYFVKKEDSYPIINICFSSHSSLMRYYKNNKDELLNKYGKLGENYFIDYLIFSHFESEATPIL